MRLFDVEELIHMKLSKVLFLFSHRDDNDGKEMT